MRRTKSQSKDLRLVNRFSWHKQHGEFAEKYLRNRYFRTLGLSFRKIRQDKKGKKPEGYVLDKNLRKIAVVEIKLIKSQKRKPGVLSRIAMDETTQRAIRRAKRQLRTMNTSLPKVIYLIRDDIFLKPETVRWAIFGKWTTIMRGDKTIFNYYSGFHPGHGKDNKMRDDLISAIICFIPTLKGHNLWVYRNINAVSLPPKLLDKQHIEELWDCGTQGLEKKI